MGDPTSTRLILDRIINEAKRLQIKEVCICECGTAFRVMKHLSGKQPFKVSSITEVQASYLREGRIKVDRSRFSQPVTYHDPCQLACNGGVIDEARYILKHLTADFRDMSKAPRYNWCCGGGGGKDEAPGLFRHSGPKGFGRAGLDSLSYNVYSDSALLAPPCGIQLSKQTSVIGVDI